MNYKNIITVKSDKCDTKHYIRKTQITIQEVLDFLMLGKNDDEALRYFPFLSQDDIIACLVYGVDGEVVSPRISRMQYDLAMKKTPQERVAIAGEMFTAARQAILDSLPPDLPEKEVKKQLYYRTYDEQLPDDFFKE